MRTSEIFMDAVAQHHSMSIECEHCGRIHFTRNDELEAELSEKQKAEPNKYCFCDDDQIGWGYLDGKQYVYDCPCDSGWRYEDWIWKHRELIVAYLKRRAAREEREARENTNLVGLLEGKP